MNKKNKYGGMIFLEGDDDSFGGGGAPASATADPWLNNGDPEPVGEEPPLERPQPGVNTPNPAPQLAAIDPEAFAKSFGQVLSQNLQQQREALPPPPMTPEQRSEALKALKFFEIDDAFVKDFGNLETQKASLERFRDGITQHLITVFNHLRENDHAEFSKRFDTEFTPVRSMLEERRAAEQQSRFHGVYPQFADPKLAPHVETALGTLAKQNAFQGKTEAEAFDVLASYLASQAKVYNPTFVLQKSSGGGASSQPLRQGNGLPTTSGGSGASHSGAGAQSPKKSWALNHMK